MSKHTPAKLFVPERKIIRPKGMLLPVPCGHYTEQGGVGTPPTSMSFLASATSIGASVTGPATIQAGDLIVLWQIAANAATPAPTAIEPAGFTNVINLAVTLIDTSTRRIMFGMKIADGSEASAALTGMDGNLGDSKALGVFRGDSPINNLVSGSPNSEIIATNPTAQVCTASSGAIPLIVFGGYASDGAVNPRTFTPAKDGEINPDTGFYLAYKIYNAAPADTTIDMDDEGTYNALASCYVSIS